MLDPLHLIVVGGSPGDLAPVLRELQREGHASTVVEGIDALENVQAATRDDALHVLLVAEDLLGAGALTTLGALRDQVPDLPIIVASPDPQVERAVAALRAGADDYCATDNPQRLASAIRGAEQTARERRTGGGQRLYAGATDLSERRFRSLIERSFEGIVLADAAGRAHYISPPMARILGYRPEELLGTGPLDVLHPLDVPTVTAALADVVDRPGGDSVAIFRLRHKDGGYRWVEARATNLLHDPSVGALVLNIRDIDEQRRADALQRRLAAVVASAEDAILSISTDDIIESWNEGAVHLFGYSRDEAIGSHISLLAAPEQRAGQATLLAEVRGGVRVADREVIRRHKDGSVLEVAITASPVLGDSGEVLGISEIVRDVSERRRVLAELERARTAAEDLARARSEFLEAVSHELLTPLTAVIGSSELLLRHAGQLSDEQRTTVLERIVAAARRQQRMVDDLLALTHVESGTLEIALAAVELELQVERAIALVAGSYPEQRIEASGEAGLQMWADPDRVVQIMTHLIDNAAKHSPDSRPVRVSWQAEGGVAVVRVQDHGAGIAEARRAQLFTRFGRLPGSRIRAGRVGTGVGLYLGRTLARTMGGDLILEQTGAEGSVFALRLPRARPGIES